MTEGKNSKSESKEEQPKLNQEQYDRLIECSKKGPEGIKEWNEWRHKNSDEEIWLQKADLREANLQGAHLWYANLQGADLLEAKLQGADLGFAKLQGAWLEVANLKNADLTCAILEGAYLGNANMENVKLGLKQLSFRCAETSYGVPFSDIEKVNPDSTNLKGADLDNANLENAWLNGAYMQGCTLVGANLRRVNLESCRLEGAVLRGAIVDGGTSFLKCKVDRDTDFRGVGVGSTRIDSDTKQLLEYNIRRMNWEDWYWGSSNNKVFDEYDDRPRRRACRVLWRLLITWPVRLFWKMSDYGRSTGRIMLTFFVLATAFAFVYSLWPCCVMVNNVVGDIRGFVHALYFSVVTMTTLGFGDIAANPDSWPGQVVLMVQVILGYVLLGALVTRLAILFTSDGPAGSFTPMDKETKELLAKLKVDKGN